MRPGQPGLIDSLVAWPDSREARRVPPSWGEDRLLCRFPTAGEAAWACRGGWLADRVLAALAARRDDRLAATAAMAGVAPRLALISARWRRAGLAGMELADREADLVVETLAALRTLPGLPARLVVRTAWHRVYGQARTARHHQARMTPIKRSSADHPASDEVDALGGRLCAAVADGTLTRQAAQSLWLCVYGWSAEEAAAICQCTAVAFRRRHCRAVAALRRSAASVESGMT